MDRRAIGIAAEAAARDYLLALGLTLVTENFRCRAGEIDLVVIDGRMLAIVEVRLRSSMQFGGAAASVGRHKQQKIMRAAQYLLMTHPELRRYAVRFDVITLDSELSADANIQWLRGAFEMQGE